MVAAMALSVAALNAQVGFGIVAGPGFQNMVGKKANGDQMTNGLLTGFHAGVTTSFPVGNDLELQTGLLFSQKGSKNNMGVLPLKSSGDYNTTTRISYLELPLHLVFKPAYGSGYFLIGFGPYLAYGITGTQKTQYAHLPAMEQKVRFRNRITQSDQWSLEYSWYRGLDAGADIFVGYGFDNGLFFRLNGQLGLLNMIPDVENDDHEPVLKNTGFGVSVGYSF